MTEPTPTQCDFAGFVREFFTVDLLPLLEDKGQRYTGEGDNALENFEWIATREGISSAQALMVLSDKHWFALQQWARGRRPNLKDVQERIKDVIIYMLLLLLMIHYHKEE